MTETVAGQKRVGYGFLRILVGTLDERADEADVAVKSRQWIAQVVGEQTEQFAQKSRCEFIRQARAPFPHLPKLGISNAILPIRLGRLRWLGSPAHGAPEALRVCLRGSGRVWRSEWLLA